MNYEYCVGCGKCAEICPVKECIVMVDELQFEDDHSPVGALEERQGSYIAVGRGEKGHEPGLYPFVTGKGITVTRGTSDARGKDRTRQKKEEAEG